MALGAGSAATVYVDVEGDLSKFRSDVAGAGDVAAKELGGGKMRRAGKVAGTALAAGAGAALVGGVSAFVDFERGMNEVFTLIPDAGEAAYGELTEQTKSFASEFGVLPDEVIPSLYDSLSAGVPRENVFAFLEEANKFAKAGATDLATSVDALTTGVNAFGLDAEDAGRVSDSLFTAVKLGKTTVDELGASLFQVAPVAGSFGVSVEEVSAAFATLTAQGTPTAQAATQIKGAIAELGKEGTKASGVFEEISGESFVDFIAGGGTVQEAAALMGDAADEAGLSIVDMFGSIEAGQAFLGLAADADASAETLEAVRSGAGATEEAFDRMEQGIGPTLDKLKARFAVVAIELGTALAPAVEQIGGLVATFAEGLSKLPGPVLAAIVGFAGLAGGLLALAGPILKATQLVKGFFALMTANPYVLLIAATIAIAVVIYKNWDEISAFLLEAWEGIKTAISDAWNWIKETTSAIWNAVSDFFAQYWPYLLGIFTGGIGLVVGLIIQNWDAIKAKTVEIWDAIAGKIGDVASAIEGFIRDKIVSPIESLIGFFESLPEKARAAWDGLRNAISNVVGDIKRELGEIAAAADRALGPLDEIAGFAGGAIGGVLGKIPGFDSGGVVPGPTGAPRLVLAHGGETFIPTHKRGMEGAGGGGGDTYVVNLHDAVIRDEDDVVRLARMLGDETRRTKRAQGGYK